MTSSRRPFEDDPEPESDRALPALSLLGPMDLVVGGQRVALPRSKKTRALLAYLAVTGRRHRRERLCSLFWDIADDPRGALRWSLSRLRQALPDDVGRIEADREEVAFRPDGLRIDARDLAAARRSGFGSLDTDRLEQLALLYRGEFLEGLELPDFLDFTAWCIAERDELRRAQGDLLAELVRRLAEAPTRALSFARQWAQIDVFNPTAQQELLRLLLSLGHGEEAEQRFALAERLFRQLSTSDAETLDTFWRKLKSQTQARPRVPDSARPSPPTAGPTPAPVVDAGHSFVGRADVTATLESMLEEVTRSGETRVALVTGEPGLGKSRLAERIGALAGRRGVEVRVGRAYEAESSRPFGPWADALSIDVQQLAASSTPESRDALLDVLRARLTEVAAAGQGMLLVLDDLQWFDRSSAELLHHVVRTFDGGALLVLLLARTGELTDNQDVMRLLRGLRRTPEFRQVELAPLSLEDIQVLVATSPGADARRVHEASRGNPLYALELLRAPRDGVADVPPRLVELVRERIERLPEPAADVLRWGAVLGHAFDFGRIESLVARPAGELVEALERLERSALLRIDASRTHERYAFAHDVIREAVYSEMSQPRRRLMHRRIARLLEPLSADAAVAADVAHHASLGGEAVLGVRACVAAGHQGLRLFANADAEATARRGLRLAEDLDEPARIEATLDLLNVLYSARQPDREEATRRIRGLAERALDLGLTRAARQGFQILSFLRWEGSALVDAHANILQAERVSRVAESGERASALAYAARCLVLLERNLQQAEAFVMEADAVTRREGKSSAAVAFARGMIAAHRGDVGAAVDALEEARDVARGQGERLAEFGALEHRVMLELDHGDPERARALAESLVDLGGRVRPGAEHLNARALLALARHLADVADDGIALREAVDEVRGADAKFELSHILTRWAEVALARTRYEEAAALGAEALEVATAMGRRSEMALARTVLAEAASRRQQFEECGAHLAALGKIDISDVSAHARVVMRVLEGRLVVDTDASPPDGRSQRLAHGPEGG